MQEVGKILFVDDQFGVRTLLVSILQDDGHEVKMAANGEETLHLFTEFKPDLILLDMKMPGMNGLETLEKIHSLGRPVSVIMMTGYEDVQDMQGKDLGILGYLAKPFDVFELRKWVSEIFNSSGINHQKHNPAQ